ncbi:MAG: hypothetical protein KAR12_09980, partial [Methylococcales bacterium]|nr:hypothetical protein [Methylococcales bacterium]
MTWNNAFSIIFVCAVLSSTWVHAAQQPEYVLDEQPVAESASEIKGTLETAFDKLQKKEPLLSDFKDKLKNLAPFWRDTDLNVKFRSYYFNR